MVRVPAYISTIISAAADEDPDEMMCFPVGLHFLLTFPTRMSKISQKSMCLYANFFRERMCFVGSQKNRLNETLVVVFCIQTHIFVRFGPSVNLEENNKFYIQFYLQPNSSANTTESSL